MKLICAWCGVAIDRSGYTETLDSETSHGMCAACCAALESQERGTPLLQHLNTIPIPVLVIDESNAVVTMNAKACDTLGRSDGAGTQSFGEVFDCIYSRNPEGCGRAIHCAGCAIRRTVTTTFKTGEPQVSVPATLSVTSLDDISQAALAITTVRTGGLVLLRIEAGEQAHRRPDGSSWPEPFSQAVIRCKLRRCNFNREYL